MTAGHPWPDALWDIYFQLGRSQMKMDDDTIVAYDLLRHMAEDKRNLKKLSAIQVLSLAIHAECEEPLWGEYDWYWFDTVIKHFVDIGTISSKDLRYIDEVHSIWSRYISPTWRLLLFRHLSVLMWGGFLLLVSALAAGILSSDYLRVLVFPP